MGIVRTMQEHLLFLHKGNKDMFWTPLENKWVVKKDGKRIFASPNEDEAVKKLVEE